MYSIRQFSTIHSHFQVTSGQMTSLPGHFRSRDVISCHVSASSRELSLLEVKCTAYANFRPSTATSGDFRSNDITSGSLSVTQGHVTSFPVT